MPPDFPKTLAECPTVPITRDCPDSSSESPIPTRLQSGHGEHPDFEDRLSQANKYILLNYHNICHKMNKLFNLDIQVNSELQSCWMTQEVQNKITNSASLLDRKASQLSSISKSNILLLIRRPLYTLTLWDTNYDQSYFPAR